MVRLLCLAGNFAIRGYALCDGQVLPIAQNQALFSILGTTYGGNGSTTFGLPDLRGRTAIHMGSGPGLSNYSLGESSGSETVTLTVAEMPSHNHKLGVQSGTADQASPQNHILATEATGSTAIYSAGQPDASANPAAISLMGGSQPHTNMQPYLTLNFQIALVGIYPSRN